MTSPAPRRPSSRAQVAKEVEDAVANISGVKHVTSTVTDGIVHDGHRVPARGQHRPRPQRRQGRDRPRSASTCRATSTSRSSAHRRRGPVDPDLSPPPPGMTLEQLSWHVDDVVKRELQGLKGVGRIERIGGVDREIRGPARSRPAAGARHHRGRGQHASCAPPTSTSAAAGARSAARSRRSARWPAPARVEELRRHQDRAARRPRGAPRRPWRGDRRLEEPRSFARLDGASRSSPSPSSAPRAPATSRRRAWSTAKLAELSQAVPGRELHPDRRRRRLHRRQLHVRHGDPARGRGARGASSCSSSCATGAPR